jgi:hypothetical protein
MQNKNSGVSPVPISKWEHLWQFGLGFAIGLSALFIFFITRQWEYALLIYISAFIVAFALLIAARIRFVGLGIITSEILIFCTLLGLLAWFAHSWHMSHVVF